MQMKGVIPEGNLFYVHYQGSKKKGMGVMSNIHVKHQ